MLYLKFEFTSIKISPWVRASTTNKPNARTPSHKGSNSSLKRGINI